MKLEAILADTRLPVTLSRIDSELSDQVKEGRCPFCGGPLHQADYDRHPYAPWPLSWKQRRRRSLCCGHCRRRTRPPSVMFLGRRVWLGVVVILVTAMCHGITSRREQYIYEQLGIDRTTLARWRRWWREEFPITTFWRARKSTFQLLQAEQEPLAALVDSFLSRQGEGGVIPLLEFLAPLSSSFSTT